jgi:S1-C subfamily serine protease
MKVTLKIFKYLLTFFLFALLNACGNDDIGKVSRGHRDAIKYECRNSSDIKACSLELELNFLNDGNEFITFEDLSDAQIKEVKIQCIGPKKFGLKPYNDCLDDRRTEALDGDLFKGPDDFEPDTPIAALEESTVVIMMFQDTGEKRPKVLGGGSGVIIDNNLIATNCHVTNAAAKNKKAVIMVKNINKDNFDSALIYKRAPKHDVCIIKRENMSEFSLKMRKIKNLKNFTKLSKGDFVRTRGTPEGMEGHTAEGVIQYLGTAGKTGHTKYGDYVISDDTKIIEHSATIAGGSSGGPLFDKNGHLIGLNTFGNKSFNFSISADHIKELLKDK